MTGLQNNIGYNAFSGTFVSPGREVLNTLNWLQQFNCHDPLAQTDRQSSIEEAGTVLEMYKLNMFARMGEDEVAAILSYYTSKAELLKDMQDGCANLESHVVYLQAAQHMLTVCGDHQKIKTASTQIIVQQKIEGFKAPTY